jgi:hypothetical protein
LIWFTAACLCDLVTTEPAFVIGPSLCWYCPSAVVDFYIQMLYERNNVSIISATYSVTLKDSRITNLSTKPRGYHDEENLAIKPEESLFQTVRGSSRNNIAH